MPADDIVIRKVPALGVVVLARHAPAFGPANIVPVVNHLAGQFEQLGIGDRVKEAGPRMILYDGQGEDITVYLALPVADRRARCPSRPSTASCRRSRPPRGGWSSGPSAG